MSEPNVVCLDLGGVVVRICRSWKEACERARVPVYDEDWTLSDEAVRHRREVIEAYQSGQLTTAEYFEHVQHALGGRYSEREVVKIHDAWLLVEYPGVGELLSELNESSGVTTACLSNTNERHWQLLTQDDGLGRYPAVAAIDRPFASHLLGFNKPDAAIFRAFEAALGVSGEQIVFYDDLPENVAAARRLGWRAERIDPVGDPAQQMRRHLASLGVALDPTKHR